MEEKQDSLTKDKDSYEQQMSELNTILDERQNELSSLDDSMRAAYSDISDIQSQIDAQNSKMASILADREGRLRRPRLEHEAAGEAGSVEEDAGTKKVRFLYEEDGYIHEEEYGVHEDGDICV